MENNEKLMENYTYTFEERMQLMRELYPTACADTNGYYDKEKMLDCYNIPKVRVRD